MSAALARADPKEQVPTSAHVMLLDVHGLATHRAAVALGGCCGVPGRGVGGELNLSPRNRRHVLADVATVVVVWAVAAGGAGNMDAARAGATVGNMPEAGQIVDRCTFLTFEDAGGFDVTC